jgi:dihydrofolate reductase
LEEKKMGKIILYIAASIDGFIARDNGMVDWLPQGVDVGYESFYNSIEYVVMGRKTYTQVLGFGEYPYKGKKSIIYSRNPSNIEPKENVEFWESWDPDRISKLASSAKGNVWLIGGAEIIHQFIKLNLIEEYRIFLIPIILGKGIPMFLPSKKKDLDIHLKLEHTQSFEEGLVELRYIRK